MDLETYASCYQGQEVAVHGKLHQNLTTLSPKELEEEIGEDVAAITKIFGEKPVGISYAYGVYNETVLQMVQKYGLRYGRGVNDTHAFSEQFNLLEFQPTCRYDDPQIFALTDRFLQMHPKEPQIFCIWGHSYEMDGKNNWSDLECFFNKISGKSDIFYGTCREVLLR